MCSFDIVSRFIFHHTLILIQGMIMISEIGQIGFDIGQNIRVCINIMECPVGRSQAVITGKILFAIHHQFWKAACQIDFNNTNMKIRCDFI